MEYSYTLGSISLTNNKISRRNDNKKCDYILCYKGRKIAVVEAKKQKLGIADGIQQAIDYARDLHLNFAYSSNGEGFVEHDFLTGKEKTLSLDAFPSPDELILREEKPLSDKGKAILIHH